jgi:hypothetical protein
MARKSGAGVTAVSNLQAQNDLIRQCADPARLNKRVDKHIARLALEKTCAEIKDIEGTLKICDEIERDIGAGECDQLRAEMQFQLQEQRRRQRLYPDNNAELVEIFLRENQQPGSSP